MPMVVILIPILIALLYCLLMQVPNKYYTFEIISFGQFCIRISLCLGSSKRLNIYIKIIRTYKEAILFINKGEILTISYDVLLIMFYMCLPYFQGKERYLGFVESFANLGCSLALFSCLVLTNLSCTVFGNLSLFNIVEFFQAANYLNIKSLLDLTCQTVADMIKGKTPEEIRKTFNIKNDFTPEEEEEVRRENQWAFE